MSKESKMIEAVSPPEHIWKVYDLFSYFYGRLVGPLEQKTRMLGLERALIKPHGRVLGVAVGPGLTLLEILRRVDRTNVVHGVDLSPKMLERTKRLISSAGYTNIELLRADARQLPYRDNTFDVLHNSYMLDLIQLKDIPIVLNEFRRVLKAGGRLVLVNMSKEVGNRITAWERFYMWLPVRWRPYITGGCRPVLMEDPVKEAGFYEVRREFMRQIIPSEIITAKKPDA